MPRPVLRLDSGASVIPSPWVGVVLALAAFRLTRLVGWDELPPVVAARKWVLGESVRAFSRPAHQPDEYVYAYRRPLLAALVHCPFCLGFWISLATYVAWALEARWTLCVCVPLALSAAVGLIAKNLDP